MDLDQQQKKISQKATNLQIQASHPESSVWVSASAGTGKTHVLTQRILRLLLNDPYLKISEILAITFTKAAAMEMQNRLIKELSEWTKMDDYKLLSKLELLLEQKPSLKDVKYARTLLAKVIDDPVGLNISTIHSFCETLLRKFPLEAGIPSSFTLIEDRQERPLLKKAWYKAIKKQLLDNKKEFSKVLELMGEFSLEDAVNKILNDKNRFYKMLNHYNGLNSFLSNLATEFNVDLNKDEASLLNNVLDFDYTTLTKIKQIIKVALEDGSSTSLSLAEKLSKVLSAGNNHKLINFYKNIYSTKDIKSGGDKPRAKLLNKKPAEMLDFDIEEFKLDEFERINSILDDVSNYQNYKITKILSALAYDMFNIYKQEKLQKSYLDFNDLIDYAENLINKVEIQDWIRYKLDSKIKHCLIDEAQDTDMQQWNILHGIIQEFYYGQGQHNKPRTTFAVGDMKQSIYRFRGANPEVFDNIRQQLSEKSANINHDFKVVGLHTSFRSTRAVLNFVDDVFSDESRKIALDGFAEKLHHQVYRLDLAGRVEIAPILTKDSIEQENYGQEYQILKGKQQNSEKLSLRQLNYKNVAEKIIQLFNSNENISPQDIMILLRNRTGMQDLIEQLTKANIPHTGSDEIYLSSSTIIDDLLAFAKVLCFQNDDLSLIQIMKSAAFNYSDEEVFREFNSYKKQKIYQDFLSYLKSSKLHNVYKKITDYKQLANKVRVFDLYVHIINDLDLAEKMMAILGSDIPAQQDQVKQTLQEFLKQVESFDKLSLLSFLHWFKKDSIKVKKNTANAKNAVRIMTIHGSKGLESNIIFLPDCGQDSVQKSISKDKLLFKQQLNGNIKYDSCFIYKTRSTVKPTLLEEEINQQQQKLFFEDDMRLLYVALTRAKGSIYISGIQDKKELSENSWYYILQQTALEKIKFSTQGYSQLENGTIVFKTPKLVDGSEQKSQQEQQQKVIIPDWAITSAEKERGLSQNKSSYALTSLDYVNKLNKEDKGYDFGNIVHKLLEELPKVENRLEYIDNYLHNKDKISLADKAFIKSSVLKILDNYGYLFSSNSLSEVKVQGVDNQKTVGIIDRIVIEKDKVYIVDYKTGKKDDSYIVKYKQQLLSYKKIIQNIYPEKQILPAILWVSTQELEII